MFSLPVALSIAGSDNSAGAGIQADLKTFAAHQVYGVTAVTCVVAEVPGKVSAIQSVAPQIVAEQIKLLFDAFPIAAVKTGMLYSRAIIDAVCETLSACFSKAARFTPLIVDPVMVATSGHSLLKSDAVTGYEERLFPMATLITPNLDEVRTLLGREIATVEAMRVAGAELCDRHPAAWLIKGGHLGGDYATDLLFTKGDVVEFSAPFVPNVCTHGTGCTYSAAIAAGMARGLPLREAVAGAKRYVSAAISQFLHWDHGKEQTDALNHFPDDITSG